MVETIGVEHMLTEPETYREPLRRQADWKAVLLARVPQIEVFTG